MSSLDSNTGTQRALTHPQPAEWMSFIYGELSATRRQALQAHLDHCATCATQVKMWRGAVADLDRWELPAPRKTRRQLLPLARWAAAAATVLALGFVVGRGTAPGASEVAELKRSITDLAQDVQRDRAALSSNAAAVATAVAQSESLRLLTEYAQVNDTQRAKEQQSWALALQAVDSRVARLRSELETVALNTEGGFQQTRRNLAQLASFSTPANPK